MCRVPDLEDPFEILADGLVRLEQERHHERMGRPDLDAVVEAIPAEVRQTSLVNCRTGSCNYHGSACCDYALDDVSLLPPKPMPPPHSILL